MKRELFFLNEIVVLFLGLFLVGLFFCSFNLVFKIEDFFLCNFVVVNFIYKKVYLMYIVE